ncbi:MAG TPA: hypothetical protein EYH30_10110 [Anaerolineales bacterium]|nr:hypothetical protein [Anaerolineae bacterium]HIQ02458.1 hypothetical protein [Anaerolineales bacterium]
MTLDLIGVAVGMLLTVLILSYLIFGDNPLYRLALHLLVGATVGYGVAVTTTTLFLQTILPALQGGTAERYGMVIPLILGLLMLFKGFPRWATLGNLSTAFLIGVGAAVVTASALLGTILPQVTASGRLSDWLSMGSPGLVNGLLVAGGTICALLAFAFTLPRRRALRGLWNSTVGVAGRIGRVFLLSAFGAAFAAALTASLSILIGRIYAIVEGVQDLLHLLGG